MLVVVGNAAETEQNYSTVGIASVVATSVPFLLESTAKEDTVLYTCHPLCPVRRATRPRCVTMLILGSSPSDWILDTVLAGHVDRVQSLAQCDARHNAQWLPLVSSKFGRTVYIYTPWIRHQYSGQTRYRLELFVQDAMNTISPLYLCTSTCTV